MPSLQPNRWIAALLLALLLPAGLAGRAEAAGAGGSSGSGTGGTGGSGSGSSGARSGSGAPVATQHNSTFYNPIGIGQAVPSATPSVNTSTTGNQVSTPTSSLGLSGTTGSSSQGASISTSSSSANRVGTSNNGLPIGSPGSGQGSPENPY